MPDWPTLLIKLKQEVALLSKAESCWLKERLAAIADIQVALDGLFRAAGGGASCADCDGECCGCGKHHITLTNLLAFLLAGEDPPEPDFGKTCPYLGQQGCILDAGRRPYNCITFFCEQLEGQLDIKDCELLRSLDKKLRREYEAVAERYPAASLRGLWIALERGGQGQILYWKDQVVVKCTSNLTEDE